MKRLNLTKQQKEIVAELLLKPHYEKVKDYEKRKNDHINSPQIKKQAEKIRSQFSSIKMPLDVKNSILTNYRFSIKSIAESISAKTFKEKRPACMSKYDAIKRVELACIDSKTKDDLFKSLGINIK